MNNFLLSLIFAFGLSSIMIYVAVRFSQLMGVEKFSKEIQLYLVMIWVILIISFLILGRWLF